MNLKFPLKTSPVLIFPQNYSKNVYNKSQACKLTVCQKTTKQTIVLEAFLQRNNQQNTTLISTQTWKKLIICFKNPLFLNYVPNNLIKIVKKLSTRIPYWAFIFSKLYFIKKYPKNCIKLEVLKGRSSKSCLQQFFLILLTTLLCGRHQIHIKILWKIFNNLQITNDTLSWFNISKFKIMLYIYTSIFCLSSNRSVFRDFN